MDPSRQPPAPPEKDRYTYDEMMERLRHRKSGGSRRVKVETPDGRVEVKRRKRRSHQPIKEKQQRLSRLRKILLFAVAPLIFVGIGGYLLVNARYESEGFREAVSQRASDILGARTEIAPFTAKGLTLNSRRIVVEPPAGSLLQQAEFSSLRGAVTTGSLFSSNWHLTSLSALRGYLRFQAPAGGVASVEGRGSPRIPIVGAGLGLSSKPDAFAIEKLHVGSADFAWHSGRKDFAFIKNATVSSNRVGAVTELHLADALLNLPGWPEFQIESAQIDLHGDSIQVRDAFLAHQTVSGLGGDATLDGTIDLAQRSAPANFVCEFDAMPAISLVEEVWKGKIDGLVDATLNFRAALSTRGSLEVTGPFWIRNGSFGDITPTKRLSAFLAEPRISRIQFHSIKGKITLAGGARKIEDIEAVAPDLVRIGGSYSIQADGILHGSLEVALSDKILNQLPGGKPDFFSPTDLATGMSSTTVELGGTSSAPIEDLTPRLEAALEKYEIESAAPPASSYPTIPRSSETGASSALDPAKKRAEDAFNQLTEP